MLLKSLTTLVLLATLLYGKDALPTRAELDALLKEPSEYLQLKLTDHSNESLNESQEDLIKFLTVFSKTAASIVKADPAHIVIAIVNFTDGFRVLFCVVPAANYDLDEISRLWTVAITEKSSILSEAFPGVDFTADPTVKNGEETPIVVPDEVSTAVDIDVIEDRDASNDGVDKSKSNTNSTESKPQEPADSGSNNGVTIGAVCGSLAAVAAIGGGSYAYKKSKDKKKQMEAARAGATSPGAADRTSPGGLANVNVHGEATPNPHNFH